MQDLMRDKASVLDWLLESRVHEYFDVAGRPVGEGRSQAYAHVHTELRTCPYSGTRYHHANPMNASALNDILPAWQDIISLLAWLGQRYRAFHRREVDRFQDLALVASAGIALADYLVLRRSKPLQTHEVPIVISGLYKVCLGFQFATFLSAIEDSVRGVDTPLPDTEGYYAHLEEEMLLVGPQEVCSGSGAMIMQAYEAMLGRHRDRDPFDPLSQLEALEVDWDAFDEFAFHAPNVWRKAVLFVILMQGFGIELSEPSLPPELEQAMNDHLKTRFTEFLEGRSGLVVEIAGFAEESSGRPLAEWQRLQREFPSQTQPLPGSQAIRHEGYKGIVQDLERVFASRLTLYQPVVEKAVGAQLAAYERFEAAVLQGLNGHLEAMMQALGFDPSSDELTPADLSRICEQTLREWPAMLARSS